jgi:ribulose 1,5-bisphosphate synthetase/thiazole synthase
MHASSLVFCVCILGALADWTTKVYDVIVVGAGPAGIIGKHYVACCRVYPAIFALIYLIKTFP